MNCLVVGASSGLGLALARRFAAAKHDLVLVATDQRDLDAVAADLVIRHGARVRTVAADLAGAHHYLDRLAAAAAELGGLDALLFPIGAVADGDDGTLGPEAIDRLLAVNVGAVAAVVARFLPELRARPRAAVVAFGSVAAARGRSANVVYSASKRALQSLAESLRHSCAGSNVSVRLYVAGYLDTQLAFGRRTLLPRADPGRLADRVLRELHRGGGAAYYPRYWRWVCAALRWMPWPVFRRLSF